MKRIKKNEWKKEWNEGKRMKERKRMKGNRMEGRKRNERKIKEDKEWK